MILIACWAVLLVGLADIAVSFMRVEELLAGVIGLVLLLAQLLNPGEHLLRLLNHAGRSQELVELGRFPHRNKLLGRDNTPEEDEYLAGEAPDFGQG